MVALKLAAAYPDHALAVAAVSAAPSFSGVSDEDILQHLSPGEIEQESFLAGLWRKITGATPVVTTDDTDPLAYLARAGGKVDRQTINARLRLLREDISPVLAEIEAPTLIVAGAKDWSRILSGSQLLDYGVSDSVLEVPEDTDHFCFYTRHDIFNAIVDDFVSHEVPRL